MTAKRKIRCGIIGCGLMGREFAVATARWSALLELQVQPEIVAICDLNESLFDWYRLNFSSIKTVTTNYQDLLSQKDIELIYCSLPHNLHEKVYIDIIQAGKHLLGEKPFGIDLAANTRILETIQKHPEIFVRCSSEFPFFPGAHEIHKFILKNPWGRIIEVNAGFLHSSDINFEKPINWKRMIEINGEYGCMGDLGMHVWHLPIRAGWVPSKVFASLSKIVTERPDGKGTMVPCKTWDNAIISGQVEHPVEKYKFPLTIKTYRIAPGEIDTWYIEILGTKFNARFSTKYPKTLQTMEYKNGGKQEWRNEDLGYSSVYKTITGGIFEFGFTDAILQMWAAFIDEFTNRPTDKPFKCVTPQETFLQHKILTAALKFGKTGEAIEVG
jgi:predicted dehydrogenase